MTPVGRLFASEMTSGTQSAENKDFQSEVALSRMEAGGASGSPAAVHVLQEAQPLTPGGLPSQIATGNQPDDNLDLMAYGSAASSLQERIASAIATNMVVVFGKSFCPFCIEATRALAEMGVDTVYFRISEMDNGKDVHESLKEKYTQRTVPYVFVNNEFVGGCDDTKKSINNGTLEKKLSAAGWKPNENAPGRKLAALDIGESRAGGALLWFPNTVDNRIVRLVGVQVMLLSILGVIFRGKTWMHWVMVLLLVEFCIRFAAGSKTTPLGAFAELLAAVAEYFGSKPHFAAGPPKQFAASIGIVFVGTAVVLNFTDNEIPAAVVLATLAFFAFLEGFRNFCFGCVVFSKMIGLGLLPSNVYQTHVNLKQDIEYGWYYMNTHRTDWEHPKRVVKPFSIHPRPTLIDLTYQPKDCDYKKDDFHLVKHMSITYFSSALAVTGLALVWKVATRPFGLDVDNVVWKIIVVLAAVLYGMLLLLYSAKAMTWPHKILKEWQHPMQGNAFAFVPIVMMLLAALANDWDNTFAKVLFWIAAPVTALLGVVKVGDTLFERRHVSTINASIMISPVGNLIASLVAPQLDSSYKEAAVLWFGLAVPFWLALFVLTLNQAIISPNAKPPARHFMFLWFAAPAVALSAYLAINHDELFNPATGFADFDFLSEFLYMMALMIAAIMMYGFIRNFFARGPWQFACWACAFPMDALAIATLNYDSWQRTDLTHVMAVIAVGAACWINSVNGLHTAIAISRKNIFRPEEKFGPGAYMKMWMEAMQEYLPRLNDWAMSMQPGLDSQHTVGRYKTGLATLRTVWQEYARQQDEELQREIDGFFPGLCRATRERHGNLDKKMAALQARLGDLRGATEEQARMHLIQQMQQQQQQLSSEMHKHIDNEFLHILPVWQKYLNAALHTKLIADAWDRTDPKVWFEIVPFVVNNLPMMMKRIKFLRALSSAMPHRAQQIGMMTALGAESALWGRLVEEVPEIIPRGAPGWVRYW